MSTTAAITPRFSQVDIGVPEEDARLAQWSQDIDPEHNLTLLGNSDVHGLVDWSYGIPEGGHRPVTLVFAEEKSAEAMQKAMENRQTAVWFKNTLVGNQVYLTPMIEKSLEVIHKSQGPVPTLQIHNHSDAES